MKRVLLLILAALWIIPMASSWAGDTAQSGSVGEATQQWLQFQRSGQAASKTPRPMSDEVARRGYQRYIDTYSYKIPESFANEDQSFIQD